MKSTILILTYLLKDTFHRWLEQPTSVLSRLIITVLLCVTSLGIFAYLEGSALALEKQIDRAGPGRVYVSQSVRGSDSVSKLPSTLSERFGDLDYAGNAAESVSIKFAFFKGIGEMNTVFNVGFYDPEHRGNALLFDNLPQFESEAAGHSVFIFSQTLPAGLSFDVTILGNTVSGIVRPMPGLLNAVGANVVLLAEGDFGDVLLNGYKDTLAFDFGLDTQVVRESVSMLEAYIATDRDYYRSIRQEEPEIVASVELMDELNATRDSQSFWTAALVILIGVVTAFELGGAATLEFDKSSFVCALIRSFGVRKRWLYLQRLLEAVAISLSAYLLSLSAVFALREYLLPQMDESLAESLSNSVLFETSLPILISLLAGSLIASIPIALGLRKKIGKILS